MKLSANTLVPLSFALALASGGAFVARTELRASIVEQRVQEADATYKEICGRLRSIESRLSGIEGQLQRIKKED